MTEKFRVGDVVRVNDGVPHLAGMEARVERVLPPVEVGGSGGVRCGMVEVVALRVPGDDGRLVALSPSVVTLLRRPVRVGDVLRASEQHPNIRRLSGTWRNTVERIESSGDLWFAAMSDTSSQSCPAPQRWYEHADGTPIDPPGAKEETREELMERVGISEEMVDDYMGQFNGAATQGAGAMMVDVDPATPGSEVTVVDRVHAKLPTADQLARAIWQTDPRVIAFCASVDDAVAPPQPANADWAKVGEEVVRRHERALDIAWTRDERGWATEAQQRAEAVLDVLRGMK